MLHQRLAKRHAAPLRQLVPDILYSIITAGEETQAHDDACTKLEYDLARTIRHLAGATATTPGEMAARQQYA
jgi:hypothetical protein